MGKRFHSVSIGIALSTLRYENPDDMLRGCNTAMYRPVLGQVPLRVFDADMRASWWRVYRSRDLDMPWTGGISELLHRSLPYLAYVALSLATLAASDSRIDGPKIHLVAERTRLFGSWLVESARGLRQLSEWKANLIAISILNERHLSANTFLQRTWSRN